LVLKNAHIFWIFGKLELQKLACRVLHTTFNTRGLGQAIWQSGDLAAQGEPQHLLVVAVKGHKRDRRGGRSGGWGPNGMGAEYQQRQKQQCAKPPANDMLTPQSLRSATLFLVTPLAPLGKPNLASDQHAVIKKRFGR